jgi:hypothetical protein
MNEEDIFQLLGIITAIGISILINYMQKYLFLKFENKKKYINLMLIIELLVVLLFAGLSITIANYLNRYWDFFSSCIFFLPPYSIYSILRIIKLKNKKRYLRQIIISFIQFLAVNIILSLVVSLYIWNTREIELIRVTKLTGYTFLYVYIRITFYLCVISFIIIEFVNLLKNLNINKYIFYRLIPLKIILIFLFLLFTNGWDEICLWDVLSDTRYSDNFIIYNIEKIEIGMEKEKVIELIGDPLYIYDNEYAWTGDGKNFEHNAFIFFMRGDFAWFNYRIVFKDNKVSNIYSHWAYD